MAPVSVWPPLSLRLRASQVFHSRVDESRSSDAAYATVRGPCSASRLQGGDGRRTRPSAAGSDVNGLCRSQRRHVLRARGWMNSFCVCAASAQQKRAQLGGVQRFAITNAHEASICLLHALMYSFCHIQKQRTNRALSCLSSVLHASRRKRLKCSAGSWGPKRQKHRLSHIKT